MAFLYQSATRDLPYGYTFRGATLKDLPIIVHLFNRRKMTGSAPDANFHSEEMRREWLTQKFNPAMDARLVFDQREHLIGYIEVWTTLAPPAHPWLWGCVHPDYEGLGIGTALLRWAEARVRMAMDLLPAEKHIAPRFGALRALETSGALCAALGWQPVSSAPDAAAELKKLSGAVRLVENMDMTCQVYEKELRPTAL